MGTLTARRPSETEVAGIGIDDDFMSSYRSSLGRLVGFFRAKGVPHDEAADLANESIVRMLVHLKRHGRDRTDLGPLVRTIARNLLVERVRKQAPVLVPLGDDIDVADDGLEPVDQLVMTERRDAVRKAIGSLSPRHRHVVGMWMDGRTPSEIARELGIKRNAVDAILHRARRSLAAKLDGGGVFGLAALVGFRVRVLFRRVTEFATSADPSGNFPAAATTIAAASLAAVLTLTSPGSSAVGNEPADIDVRERSALTGATAKSVVEENRTTDELVDRAKVRTLPKPHTTYEMPIGNIGSSSSDKEGESIAELSYDPEKGGRGPVDGLLETFFKSCVTSGACLEKSR